MRPPFLCFVFSDGVQEHQNNNNKKILLAFSILTSIYVLKYLYMIPNIEVNIHSNFWNHISIYFINMEKSSLLI